jgi:transcriptional regulator with XRE-family HTH domain
MTKPKYSTVEEMAAATIPNAEFNKELNRQLTARSVANHLVALRGAKGLSQQDVADRMDCSQSRISKMEQTDDEDLRLGDVARYLNAVEYTLHIGMTERRQPLVDQVKYHVFAIRQALRRLIKLAHVDEDIARGVAGFFGEACYNFIIMMQKSAEEMPPNASGEPLMRIDVIGQNYEPEPQNCATNGSPSDPMLSA